ncbi:17762_t:CDS:1, partial [Cetraspora pellucida]
MIIVGSDDSDVDNANIKNADIEEAIAKAEADKNNDNSVGLDKVDVLCLLDFISLLSNCLEHFK